MAYLELKDLSKIYAGEKNISVGIRKISIAFDKGEFVAVTGKSGAGKTTLLNVIGGMESYEEGEMYIGGKPTSPFTQQEWEEYQAENISYIFQNYNILESFTVLENVEFALTNITDLKERKAKAREIVERVGLKARADIRGSKLSGGEKQRTVIARAIAKDSPIILADEPTGNLDSKTAKEILELLKEVSENKLTIVVTHNFEDVEPYATRHIRVFDGQIESDECIKGEKPEITERADTKDFSVEREFIFRKKYRKQVPAGKKAAALRDGMLLGWKRFLSRPKQSILMSSVLAVALICMMCVVSFMSASGGGYYQQYINPLEGRILVADKDGTGYTQDEADELAAKYGAEFALRNDCFLDKSIYANITDTDYIWEAFTAQITFSGKKPQEGRLPQEIGEVALYMPYTYRGEVKLGDEFKFGDTDDNMGGGVLCKVVGVGYFTDNRKPMQVCVTPETYALYSNISRYEVYLYEKIINDKDGSFELNNIAAHIPIMVDLSLEGINAVLYGNEAETIPENPVVLFSEQDKGLKITDIKYGYTNDYDSEIDFAVAVSEDFARDNLSWQESEQISLMYPTDKLARANLGKLEADGYQVVLASALHQKAEDSTLAEKIIIFFGTGFVTLLVGVVLVFIVILTLRRLVLATKGDISIFRTMGIKEKTVKRSTYVQLLCALVPACIVLSAFVALVYFTPIGRGFTFVGVSGTVTILLVTAAVVWLLGAGYNRILYKERVKKGLRRVNK